MSRTGKQADDELLVMRCQDGSTEAFEELVRRWQRPLWRHARVLTGRADAAWEVVQEAWLGIVKGIDRLSDPARFAPWAYRIVRNRAATWIAAAQRRRRDRQEVEVGGLESSPRREGESEVRTALAGLPDDLRSVLTLHYLDELAVREIADVLRIPEGTVKSRLHTARRVLREKLERSPRG